MSVSINIKNLTKVFGSGSNATRAVDGVDLTIEPGELFFLLGPSGCGKTTLLRMLAGFIDPTSGLISFGDRDVTHLPPNKRNTGMVFQSYALWPHMTVADNVGFGLGIRKVPAEEKSKRIAEALSAVHMGEYADRKPNQLSGGQQQRVALARALVVRPDVLLLDEPLSNLDAKLRVELRSEIRRICKTAGITTVYVTHDQKEALSMADRVAILDAGRVKQLGKPEDLYRSPNSAFVASFLGETNFVPGTIKEQRPDGVLVETPAGTLLSAHAEHVNLDNGSKDILCSIRPEAVNFANGASDNALSGAITDTVYLGELAQHEITLPGDVALRISELNPIGRRTTGDNITITVAPNDVVLVRPN